LWKSGSYRVNIPSCY